MRTRSTPRSRAYLFAGGVLLLALVFGGYQYFTSGTFLHGLREQDSPVYVYMPDFSFPNEKGEQVVFTNIQAPVRVVHFWASWSPYSREELPALVTLERESEGVIKVVALNRDTNPADGRAFLRDIGLASELTFAYDAEDTYFRTIGGYNMPETIFVGPRGEVLEHVHGPMSLEEMRSVVERIQEKH